MVEISQKKSVEKGVFSTKLVWSPIAFISPLPVLIAYKI